MIGTRRGFDLPGAVLLIALALSASVGAADVGPPILVSRGFVTDEAGVIPAEKAGEITALLTELQQKTGAEIAILAIPSTLPLDDFDYATAVFDRWKVGKRGKDNGVLMLVAVRDRKVRIITGYGVEGILPDGKVGEIIDTAIVPSFREGDYGTGVLRGAWAIAQVIAADARVTLTGSPPAAPAPPAQAQPPAGFWIFLAFVLLMMLSGFMNAMAPGRRRGWTGGGYTGGWGGGGFGGGGGGGGFGGFGGGSHGGGGAGRGW